MAARPTIFTPAYYEALEAVESHPWVRHVEAVQDYLLCRYDGPRVAHWILDAGCGTGGFALRLRSHHDHSTVWGVDSSVDAARRATERGLPAARGSVTELPCDSEMFGTVVCADVIQHLPETSHKQMLRELFRVLRGDGVLLMRTSHRKGLGRNRHRDSENYRQFEAAQLRSLLEHCGFADVETCRANALPALMADWWARGKPAPVGDTGLELSREPWLKGAALAMIWWAERRAIRWGWELPYGHTLFAVARKPES